MAHTELFVCVDSDDYLLETPVADILSFWELKGSQDYSGIVALNRTSDGKRLGRTPDIPFVHLIDLRCRYGCTSDLKMVYRTELLKENAPIPGILNERYMNPYYLFLKIDQSFPNVREDERLYIVRNICEKFLSYFFLREPRKQKD